MKHKLLNNSGLSIIATVMVMMILALFVAIGVSLVTTGSNIAVQEERGLEAFYIADGGLQYTAKTNLFPYFTVASISSPKPLGEGSFYTTLPTLSAGITNVFTGPITVSSTDGFTTTNNPLDATPIQYWIMMCDTAGNPTPSLSADASTCEKISCGSKFSTCTRGRDSSTGAAHIGNIDPSSAAVVLMYSWDILVTTNLSRNLAANNRCTSNNTRICVNNPANFADSGFIRITDDATPPPNETDIEDVLYIGNSINGGNCGTCPAGGTNGCLGTVSCVRLAYGDARNPGVNGVFHNNGTQIWQSEISVLATSTGVVPGAILTGNIKRVVQGRIMPLQ